MRRTVNAWQGSASTSRRHYPNAPTARWSGRRWRGVVSNIARSPLRKECPTATDADCCTGAAAPAFAIAHAGDYGSRLALRLAGTTDRSPLPVLVRRLPLLDERRHAFGAVLQRAG